MNSRHKQMVTRSGVGRAAASIHPQNAPKAFDQYHTIGAMGFIGMSWSVLLVLTLITPLEP